MKDPRKAFSHLVVSREGTSPAGDYWRAYTREMVERVGREFEERRQSEQRRDTK